MSFDQLLLAGESETLEDIQTDNYQSHLRNKLGAEAFYLTNNIEKYGSGFIRIRKALQDYPQASFEVREMGGDVPLTFAQAVAWQKAESGVTTQRSSEKSSQKIFDLLTQSPTMTAKELAQHLGISQRAIEKQIGKLKLDGRLHRVGPDNGGPWQVLKAFR